MNAIAPISSPVELLHTLRVDSLVETRPVHREDELRSRAARSPSWPLITLAAAAGVAVSLLLVPRVVSFDKQSRVPVLQRLEAAVAAGDHSAGTLIALARERQRMGDAAGALAMLQDLIGQQPRQAIAWQALADHLNDLGRTDDAVAALERAQRLEPRPERQAQIAMWRADTQQAQPDPSAQQLGSPQAAAQASATDPAAPNTPGASDRVALLARAEGLIAAGSPAEALALLDNAERSRPEPTDVPAITLRMRALLAMPTPRAPNKATNKAAGKAADTAGPDAAASLAKTWLEGRASSAPDDAVRLASVLSRSGHHLHAAKLLEPWLSPSHEGLLGAWTEAMTLGSRADAATARLTRLSNGAGSDGVLRQRIRLAVETGRLDNAFDIVRNQGAERVPPDVLAHLVDAIGRDSKRLQAHASSLRDIWSRAGSRLERYDALAAARVAWAAGELGSAARLADAALPSCEGKADCAVRLAWLNHQLGRGPETAAALKAVEGPVDDTLVHDYARLASLHGLAGDALARLERHRRPVPGALYEGAWALLATAAGKQAEVQRWLRAVPDDELAVDTLRELFDAAVRSKAHGLTVAIGLRLDPRQVRPADRVLLAQALMDSGRTADALAQWRLVRTSTRAYDDAYASALRMAVSRGVGADARQEFARARVAALDKLPAAEHAAREAIVRQLLDLGAHAEAMPALEALAQSNPESWLSTFEDLARRQGANERLVRVWRRVANQPSTGQELRLRVTEALAAAGESRAARANGTTATTP